MMMRPVLLISTALALSLAASCTHAPPQPADDPWERAVAELGGVDAGEFARLSASERDQRRRLAEEGLATLRLWNHERMVGGELDFAMDTSARDLLTLTRYKPDGLEFDEAVRRCRLVVETDPTHARVWYELGRIGTETGDWTRALADLETAWSVLPRDPRARTDPYLEHRIALAGAWLQYDLGRWEEGLAWLARHRGAWGVDLAQEEMLARGLLLAGAGRFQDAYLVALAMPPLRIRAAGMYQTGLGKRQSGYGNRWIQAMSWFHQGEEKMAVHALGTPASSRIHIPQMSRYWNDVAILFGAQGRTEEARLDHALGLIGRAPMLYYMPIEAYSFPPVICGHPDVTVPFATIHEDRYVAGSLFSYACQLMSDCSAAPDPALRDTRGGKAVEAFTVCMLRRDRPALAQALRGRTRFYMGEGGAALPDLLASRRALIADGLVDPVTSTIIGTVYMNLDRAASALDYLDEAVVADPELSVAWRTYGVALAKVNRHAEADTAMDRAVALDPYAVSGWYNRGLHHINRKRFEPAREDLLVASGLAPDNLQIRQLIGRLERDWELADDPDLRAVAEAKADSVSADLVSGEWLARNTTDDLALDGGRHVFSLADMDFEARADSLAAVHADAPTPQTRQALAAACVRAGRAERALELLVQSWPDELSTPEMLLVLQADRDLGNMQRALEMAASLADRPPTVADMEFWTLVALICLDHGDHDLGLRALDVAIGLAPANHALTSYRKLIVGGGGR